MEPQQGAERRVSVVESKQVTSAFVLYLAIGRLIIYIVQKFVSDATRIELLNKWASCDLCSGVWIYSALAYFMKINIFSDIMPYVPFVTEVITGVTCSMIVHLLVLGWKSEFEVVVI